MHYIFNDIMWDSKFSWCHILLLECTKLGLVPFIRFWPSAITKTPIGLHDSWTDHSIPSYHTEFRLPPINWIHFRVLRLFLSMLPMFTIFQLLLGRNWWLTNQMKKMLNYIIGITTDFLIKCNKHCLNYWNSF